MDYVRFGHVGGRHERRLTALGNHEAGLPGSGHWWSSVPAVKRVHNFLLTPRHRLFGLDGRLCGNAAKVRHLGSSEQELEFACTETTCFAYGKWA